MVPRTSMVALEADMPLSEVVARIVEEGHSRYPVYRGSIDDPIGVLCAKDVFQVLRASGGFDGTLADLVRPAYFCAESQKISDLLRQLQARRVHLAIVVDEYGGTSGIVALEDIIEEIVGEIRDEHDLDELPVRKLGQGRYMVDADVSAHDVAELTGLELPEEAQGFDSLGGLVIDLAGRVPEAGESVRLGAHDLIVRDADERRVRRIELVPHLDPAA
jgi:CBS domain containing-hemolysin-like protein